jgi:hypothetical protein
MPLTLRLYMDDSGTRHPNHQPLAFHPDVHDPFALGGVIVRDEDEDIVREAHAAFCAKWSITYPLHSAEIRNRSHNFSWLRHEPDKRDPFLASLQEFLLALPVLGLACTIDRPGYDARYREKYGRNQWHLCKTAFDIVAERACKYALAAERRLRVCPERCSKKDDARLEEYFYSLKSDGLPFDGEVSRGYKPLCAAEFASVLYEIDFKKKTSPLAQIADLYLWPMVKHGYMEYAPYARLREHGRLVDCHLAPEQCAERGSKYSCFELVTEHRTKNTKGPDVSI